MMDQEVKAQGESSRDRAAEINGRHARSGRAPIKIATGPREFSASRGLSGAYGCAKRKDQKMIDVRHLPYKRRSNYGAV